MNKTFGLIGGDRRQAELARLLKEKGNTVWTYGRTRGPWHGTITWNRGYQNIRCFSSSI